MTGATVARLPPVGFWSYARQDDSLSSGKLTTLRSLLIHELQQQYGREQIRLFQDASTIAHGADWEKEIKKAIDASTFFIPIITPNFLQSEWCAREVELFLEREQALFAEHPGLRDRGRIFPILFIDVEDVEPENPAVLAALQKLQWFDFRRFRHRSYDDAEVREALSDLAGTIRSLLRVKLGSTVTAPPQAAAAEPAPEPPPAPTEVTATSPRPARPIETGDLLNHMFEVKRFIKAGGMGQVFEGSNVMTGERVAIKALLPAMAADPKVTELFQREALTLTRLNHEALVQYRALAKEPELGALYIVTEYVDGTDLGDALDTVERGPEELKRLLGRLAAGLAAAHRLGAIHRDMSPDNVMLPGGDLHQAKIIDFGIAKDLAGNLPTLIGDGFAGKLNYVAPEQLGEHGGEVGPWTDVYSLALVILAVAGGRKPDMSGSFADAIRKRREAPDLSAAPDALRPLLEDMLRSDPAERLRSMDAVIERLNAPPAPSAAAAPPPMAPEEPTVVSAPPPEPAPVAATPAYAYAETTAEPPSRRWLLPVILLGIAIVAAAAWFLLSGRASQKASEVAPANAAANSAQINNMANAANPAPATSPPVTGNMVGPQSNGMVERADSESSENARPVADDEWIYGRWCARTSGSELGDTMTVERGRIGEIVVILPSGTRTLQIEDVSTLVVGASDGFVFSHEDRGGISVMGVSFRRCR